MATYYMAPASPPDGWAAGNNANTGLTKNESGSNGPKLTWKGVVEGGFAGGDTLVIAPGTYTGQYVNEFSAYSGSSAGLPPSGTAGTPTIIMAEVEGTVFFDGQNAYYPFVILSEGDMDFHYVEFRGIIFSNPADGYSGVYISYGTTGISHIKFLRCGAYKSAKSDSRTTGFYLGSGKYMLCEDCYVWGTLGRGFVAQNIMSSRDAGGEKIIFRRCVVRQDDATCGTTQNENGCGFISYSCQDVEFQNCLVLDGDTSKWEHMQYHAAFATRRTQGGYGTSKNNHWRGCVVANITGWAYPNGNTMTDGPYPVHAFSIHNEDTSAINTLTNCVAVDVPVGAFFPRGVPEDQVGAPTMTNLTIVTNNDPAWGGPYTSTSAGWENGFKGAYGIYQYSSTNLTWSLTNSIVMCSQNHAVAGVTSDYNAVYSTNLDFSTNMGAAGANDYTDDNGNEVNPLVGSPAALTYPLRIESGSTLNGTGSGGADRGANVIYRYGVDGSHWGDSGYNSLTTTALWPFPYEETIRTAFRSFSPSSGPNSSRGFCASGETLTHYLWNWFGNGSPYDELPSSGASTTSSPGHLAFLLMG